MIEEMPIGRAIHHRTNKAVLFHRAMKLLCRIVGAQHRQRGKSCKAIGMFRASGGQIIVNLAGHGDAIRARHQIRAGAAIRQHFDINAGLIHQLQTLLADLGQQREWIGYVRTRRSRLVTRFAIVSLSTRLAAAGTEKCSSSMTVRIRRLSPFARDPESASRLPGRITQGQ